MVFFDLNASFTYPRKTNLAVKTQNLKLCYNVKSENCFITFISKNLEFN